MRAVQRAADGTLGLVLHPTPAPAEGQVLVRLRAVAVNPLDLAAQGVPGCGGAGIVAAVGPGVSPQRCGEDVWLLGDFHTLGSYAEFVALPAECAVSLPAGIGYEQAATLGVAAVIAHHALLADGDVRGRSVIVADAAGAVGGAAVQLAKWKGAHVIGTVDLRPEEGIAREAGADEVVNCRCGRFLNRLAQACGFGGVDRWIGGLGDDDRGVPLSRDGVLARWDLQPGCRPMVRFRQEGQSRSSDVFALPQAVLAGIARDINTAIGAAALRPVVAQVFRLDQAPAAHSMLRQGGVPGSLVLKP
ncbi:MAG TPA: zinc-binding dehydrogenase [Burkholderiales bacterium]